MITLKRDGYPSRAREEGTHPTAQIVYRGAVVADEATVLVVDDNADTNEALVRLLTLYGHHAVSAYDGQEALDYLHEGHRPAVIVLDVRMPILDGETFRSAQVADPDLAGIPVVVYSAVEAPDLLGRVPSVRKGSEPERVVELIERFSPPRTAARRS